jgi:hypothetical protein
MVTTLATSQNPSKKPCPLVSILSPKNIRCELRDPDLEIWAWDICNIYKYLNGFWHCIIVLMHKFIGSMMSDVRGNYVLWTLTFWAFMMKGLIPIQNTQNTTMHEYKESLL